MQPNIYRVLKEISETPLVVIQNEPIKNIFPHKLPLRRTHTITCIYCGFYWGDILFTGSRLLTCSSCKILIEEKVIKKRYNLVMFELTQKFNTDYLNIPENLPRSHLIYDMPETK